MITLVDIAPRSVEIPTSLAYCWLGWDHGANAQRELHLGPTTSSRRNRGG